MSMMFAVIRVICKCLKVKPFESFNNYVNSCTSIISLFHILLDGEREMLTFIMAITQ